MLVSERVSKERGDGTVQVRLLEGEEFFCKAKVLLCNVLQWLYRCPTMRVMQILEINMQKDGNCVLTKTFFNVSNPQSNRSAAVSNENRAPPSPTPTSPGGYGMARYRLQTVVCFIDGGLDAHMMRSWGQSSGHLSTAITPLLQCYKYVTTTDNKTSQLNIQPHHLHVHETSWARCSWTKATHNHLSRKGLNFSHRC